MVLLEAGKLPHKKFLNIWNLGELRGIVVTAEHVTLGALTTYAEVQRHEILVREFPLLCRAAAETGSVATQNRGTLGGNIANASPAADSPPALIVYDAEIEIVSAGGARWIHYASFHTGYKKMNLQAGELIRADSSGAIPCRVETILPQSGDAARAGDFEDLFCGRGADGSGPDRGCAHCVGERGAYGAARESRRGIIARATARECGFAGCAGRTRCRDRAD